MRNGSVQRAGRAACRPGGVRAGQRAGHSVFAPGGRRADDAVARASDQRVLPFFPIAPGTDTQRTVALGTAALAVDVLAVDVLAVDVLAVDDLGAASWGVAGLGVAGLGVAGLGVADLGVAGLAVAGLGAAPELVPLVRAARATAALRTGAGMVDDFASMRER